MPLLIITEQSYNKTAMQFLLLLLHEDRLAGRQALCSQLVYSFVHYCTKIYCEQNILKMMQIGTSNPWSKGM